MGASRFTRMKEILLAVVDLGAKERTAYLDASCKDDPDLRREIESILAFESDSSGNMKTPDSAPSARSTPPAVAASHAESPSPAGSTPHAGAEPPQSAPPTTAMSLGQVPTHPVQIGPYRILEPIGEGGMGIVYIAEQTAPVRRRVALKVIKLGMDTKQVVARFEAERQALALMDHPNIAKVLGAGATEDGRPYFAMEHVRGIAITDYCDRHQLKTRDRLALFIHVCEAIQHAHQKGVIHRDLKPSNVLVEVIDATPVPKVIDFGIAKATAQRLTERTVFTEQGQLIGTPEYMSPEQAEMTGLNIDTRTDIYSLGILLYELLVGALPFDPQSLRSAGYAEIQRILREVDPPRPSTRLTALGANSTTMAKRRGTDRSTLLRQLRRDLDWITMRAIDKDRTRRYQSASEFAADIQRYLSDQPVTARHPSTAYQLKKLVLRHKTAFAFLSTLMTLLLVFSVWMSVLYSRADRNLTRALAAETKAADEAEISKQVSDFLIGLFEVSDPAEARGANITAREILDRGAERIEAELKDQPRVQAQLMDKIGQVYASLGLYDQAEAHIEHALAYARSLPHGDPELLAGELMRMAWLRRQQGRFEEALACCRESLEIWEKTLGHEHLKLAHVLQVSGILNRDMGRYAEARRDLERSLAIRRKTLGPNHIEVASSLYHLGWLLKLIGDYGGAERTYREALMIAEKELPPDHPQLAWFLNDLGIVLTDAGNYAGAKVYFERAIAIREKVLGPNHPDLAATLTNLGAVAWYMDEQEAARAYYERALRIEEESLGPDHPQVAASLNNLALALRSLGRWGEAIALLQRALDISERAFGPNHRNVALAVVNLAGVYAVMGDYARAQSLYERALAIREEVFGEVHPEVAETLHELARLSLTLGNFAEAESMLERALVIRRETLESDHKAIGENLYDLASVCRYTRQYTEAESLYKKSLEIFERTLGRDSYWGAMNLLGLAALRANQGRLDEAKSLYSQGDAIMEGLEDPKRMYAIQRQAGYWALLKQRDQALRFLHRSLDLGYRDEWIVRDPDMASLRGDPEFRRIVAEVQRRIKAGRRTAAESSGNVGPREDSSNAEASEPSRCFGLATAAARAA